MLGSGGEDAPAARLLDDGGVVESASKPSSDSLKPFCPLALPWQPPALQPSLVKIGADLIAEADRLLHPEVLDHHAGDGSLAVEGSLNLSSAVCVGEHDAFGRDGRYLRVRAGVDRQAAVIEAAPSHFAGHNQLLPSIATGQREDRRRDAERSRHRHSGCRLGRRWCVLGPGQCRRLAEQGRQDRPRRQPFRLHGLNSTAKGRIQGGPTVINGQTVNSSRQAFR